MSKAFDCVVHDVLLTQLENIGVRGIALKLFESYLKNREQCTVIETFNNDNRTVEEVFSGHGKVTLGVPQGSVLGPLLFLVYVNELPKAINHVCVMFADDATVFISGENKDKSEFENEINKTLKDLVDWLKKLNLIVNPTKTKFIQLRNYRTDSLNLKIYESNSEIKEVN